MGSRKLPKSPTRGSGDDRLIAAIGAIYDAAPDPSLWPKALQAIADCFGDVGAILIWRRDDGGFGTIVSPALIAAQQDYEDNKWHLRDLPSQRVIERELWVGADAWSDRECVSEEEMESDPFYTDFCARHRLFRRIAFSVAPDPHISVWIAVQRGDRKPYAQGEFETAVALGRHVEKSLRLSIRLLDAQLANVGLGAALSRLGVGVFALDSLVRPIFFNPAGKRMLGPYIKIVEGRLQLGSVDERREMDAMIEEMVRGRPEDVVKNPRPVLLQRTPPERPLVVYVLPVTPRDIVGEQFMTRTRAMVLVIKPEAGEPADPAVVRDVLGLTLGEARVAALIGSGMTPRQTSERLEITEETTRTVLKRIYKKVGVSRQNELTALLMKTALSAPKD